MASLDKTLSKLHFKAIKGVFEKVSEGLIKQIPLDFVSPVSMRLFEGYSQRFILPEEYFEGNFEQSFVIDSDDYTRTFVVTQTKIYDNGEKEHLTYLSTLDCYANELAHGELRYDFESQDTYFKNKPFAGYTSLDNKLLCNDPEFVNLRLDKGINQLNMMNGLSQALYRLPMHSDTLTIAEEKPIWMHLLNVGKVTLYKEGKNDRFVFNHSPATIFNHELN